MTLLTPSSLDAFVRRFRWEGAMLKQMRFSHRGTSLNLDAVVKVARVVKALDARAEPVRLHLRCTDLEECRIQKRVGTQLRKLANMHFSFLQGQFFIAFDEWALGSKDKPAVFDFRGCESYLSAKDIYWAELPKRSA